MHQGINKKYIGVGKGGGGQCPPNVWVGGPWPFQYVSLKLVHSMIFMILPHVLAGRELVRLILKKVHLYIESCHRCTFLMIAMFISHSPCQVS